MNQRFFDPDDYSLKTIKGCMKGRESGWKFMCTINRVSIESTLVYVTEQGAYLAGLKWLEKTFYER